MKRTALLLSLLLLVPLDSSALTLAEGLAVVTTRGRDVRIAGAEEAAAGEALRQARSPLLPRADLYARQTWLRYRPEADFGLAGPVPLSQRESLAYGFRVNQLLYDFGRASSGQRAARFGFEAKRIETSRARNLAALDFTLAYLGLLESERILKVARDEVRRFEAHLEDTRAMYEEGIVVRNDLLQAEVTLSDSRQRLLKVENLRDMRASRINSLLQRPLNEEVSAEEVSLHPLPVTSLESAWESAELRRPELKGMTMRVRAKEEELRSIRAELYPSLYLSAGYEYRENRYMVHEENWSLLAGMSLNLYSGGSVRARIGKAEAELEGLLLASEKLLDDIRLEVKEAYLQLEAARRGVDVTREAVAQADENLRLQRLRYQEGVGTATDVLDAVALMSRAERNYWSALYGLKRAEAALLYAMGVDISAAYGAGQQPSSGNDLYSSNRSIR